MIKLAVSGCQGRMGQRIIALALEDKMFQVTSLLESPSRPDVPEQMHGIQVSKNPSAIKGCDVLIEFTLPEGTMQNLEACLKYKVPMVIGTTGLASEHFSKVNEAAQHIPIVISGNMSLGVNIVFNLTSRLAHLAPDNYVANIVEAHHIHKKDKPSGTAKMLEEFIDLEVSDNKKTPSNRKRLITESIRKGEIVGDHSVIFESEEDIITISHHAKNRDIFAKGALAAAKFLIGKKPGRYDMGHVLGLKPIEG